jgi:serine protease Do
MKKMIFSVTLIALLNVAVNAQEVVIIKKSGKDTSDKPLIIVDGVVSNTDMNQMSPTNIQSINVLKGNMATNKYGEQGSKGVIEITSKKKGSQITVTAKEINVDTIINGDKDTAVHKKVNLSIVVDGDKITINGKPADKNDPRLKMMGKSPRGKNEKTVIIEDVTTQDQPAIDEGSDDVMDLMAPPAPPTNSAFLGVMSEENEKGAKVNVVSEESPAEKAGLKPNDIINKVNDKPIDGPKSLYEVVGAFKPNDKIKITYLRDGKELTANAILAKNKAVNAPRTFMFSAPNGQMPNNMRRGFNIRPGQNFNFEMPELPELNELDGLKNINTTKPKLGISVEDIESAEGVKIKNVTPGSPAEKAGLQKNDVITSVNDKKVKDVDGIKPIISGNNNVEGSTLKFNINRNGKANVIEVKFPKKLKTADL